MNQYLKPLKYIDSDCPDIRALAAKLALGLSSDGGDARFSPPDEKLASPVNLEGEADLPEIWPEPLPVVVSVLENSETYKEVYKNLPD